MGDYKEKLEALVQDGVLAGHNWSLINYSYSESRQELSANSSNIGKALVRPYAPKNAIRKQLHRRLKVSLVLLLRKTLDFSNRISAEILNENLTYFIFF